MALGTGVFLDGSLLFAIFRTNKQNSICKTLICKQKQTKNKLAEFAQPCILEV
jgi:hypothetical protein